jgi:hypothetical protein
MAKRINVYGEKLFDSIQDTLDEMIIKYIKNEDSPATQYVYYLAFTKQLEDAFQKIIKENGFKQNIKR